MGFTIYFLMTKIISGKEIFIKEILYLLGGVTLLNPFLGLGSSSLPCLVLLYLF